MNENLLAGGVGTSTCTTIGDTTECIYNALPVIYITNVILLCILGVLVLDFVRRLFAPYVK